MASHEDEDMNIFCDGGKEVPGKAVFNHFNFVPQPKRWKFIMWETLLPNLSIERVLNYS